MCPPGSGSTSTTPHSPARRATRTPTPTTKDQLARNLVQKFITYGTGADVQFADREVVEQPVTRRRGWAARRPVASPRWVSVAILSRGVRV